MLSIKNLTFSYTRKGEPTIRDFSLEIQNGGVYGLLGSNGAGKSTLFQLIAGLLTPTSGQVDFMGINTRRRLPETLANIRLMPEEVALPPIPLKDFVKYCGPLYPNFSNDDFRKHLDLFDMPVDIHLGMLSMGQRKKVALAFAMACNTSLLLLDEPTNGLDIPSKTAFRRFIASSISDDRLCIISTHQVRDVTNLLDHVLIIDNQRVLMDASMNLIQSRLKFIESTSNPEIIQNAIYQMPGIGGSAVVVPNLDGNETAVNLEMLYNFAVFENSKLNQILK